jgi:glucokinase
VRNSALHYIGVDIGGTKTSVCLGDQHAAILKRARFSTPHYPGSDRGLAEIIRNASELTGKAKIARIGVSCAGPLDASRGIVQSPPNLPGWDDVPVCRILSEALDAPARLENDANAAALAEWKFGAGRGLRDMVFLTCSTGLGAGLILDGKLYQGRHGLAGEVGHMRITAYGPQLYGKSGSFEGWASGSGLLLQTGRSAEDLAASARLGDQKALAAITRAGEMLGRGIALICDILNPELVVCGTLAVRLGDLYLGPARQVLAAEALDPCPVVPSALGDDLAERAALTVAMLE